MARILVVDDESATLDLLEVLLKKQGYEIHKATSVDKAVALLSEYGYNVILSEVIMPEQGGFDLLGTVKRRGNGTTPRFILTTAKPTESDLMSSIELGADAYVEKPFDTNYLISLVNLASKKHQRILRAHNLSEPQPLTFLATSPEQAGQPKYNA